MKKRKPFVMIATGVLSLSLYGCGMTEEDLREECEKKSDSSYYDEESGKCLQEHVYPTGPEISNPPIPEVSVNPLPPELLEATEED